MSPSLFLEVDKEQTFNMYKSVKENERGQRARGDASVHYITCLNELASIEFLKISMNREIC